MSDLTPRLQLEAVAPSGGDNHASVNLNTALLEAAACLDIIGEEDDPSGLSPSSGDLWIVGSTPVGDFSGQAGKVALYRNGWIFRAPRNGLVGRRGDKSDTLWAYSEAESLWHPVAPYWSTSEHWTGRYGKGGTKVYAKCIEGIAVASGSAAVNTAHGITGLDLNKPVGRQVWIHDGTDTYQLDSALTGTVRLYAKVDATNLVIDPDNLPSAFTADARLEYQKTA